MLTRTPEQAAEAFGRSLARDEMRSSMGGSECQDNDFVLEWMRDVPEAVAKGIHEWANDWTFDVSDDLRFRVFRGYAAEYADARYDEAEDMEPCYD